MFPTPNRATWLKVPFLYNRFRSVALFFALLLINFVSVGQNAMITVRGSIVGDQGAPLLGATIAVKGGSAATTANADGSFVLNNVAENAILVFSFSGYTS